MIDDDFAGPFRCTYRGETTDFIPSGIPSVVSSVIGALNEREGCERFYIETSDSIAGFYWLVYSGDEDNGVSIDIPEHFGRDA